MDEQFVSHLLDVSGLAADLKLPLTLQALPGEVDHNFHLRTADHRSYLLKVTRPASFDPSPILDHLQGSGLSLQTPTVLRTRTVETPAGPRTLRLHTWIEGRLLATVSPRTPDLRQSWGRACGQLSAALAELDYPAARRHCKWDPLRVMEAEHLQTYLTEVQRGLTTPFFDRLRAVDFSDLRKQVNYNDAHEHNLLVGEDARVSGVIDFGDAVYTATVCEVAIACAYAGMDAQDPLGAMREIVEGFTDDRPLLEPELALLYDLVCARLLLTVTAAAENASLHPDNEYLIISARPAWALLEQLYLLPPGLAHATFRVAAGFPAHPSADRYRQWAATAELHPVMDIPVDTIAMDLGVGSEVLGLNQNFEDLERFIPLVRRHLEDRNSTMGVGGYGEVRPVYNSEDFNGEGNDGHRWRTVHLGLDLWTRQAGPAVYAPCDGIVEHAGGDPTAGGYGATILLRHAPEDGLEFWTLYGHLSAASLDGIRAGAQVRGGQRIAALGGAEENGGWPPHLHFQVVLDLLDMGAGYPGVAYPETRDVWLGLCPDPRTLIPADLPSEMPPPAPEARLRYRRKAVLGYGLSLSYARPLHILRGSGNHLYDATGRRYLDTVNNVAHVGHEHPRVVEAARRQLAVLNTNSRYLHDKVLSLAEQLTALLPDTLSVVHFVNSGSEANELALRMAETVTGSKKILAMEMGYHGNTSRTIDVSSYKFARRGGRGRSEDTRLLSLPDPLRGKHRQPDVTALATGTSFIGEAILSCGGQRVLPEGYLSGVYAAVRQAGGITIADEVQTGLGRVGTHWWAFEQQGVVPDIVTIGKPFGNGHPLGAVVCTPAVAEAFHNGMEYFNTFGGNPVSAAVGLAVLEVIREEGLREQAEATGRYLREGLTHLRDAYEIIADVRGPGLFQGIELAVPGSLAPASPQAAYLKNRMRQLGILMSTDGPGENVMKLKPPLCFGTAEVDRLLYYLRKVLGEDGMPYSAN